MDDVLEAVIDCSALIDLLTENETDRFASKTLHAPSLIDYELASAAARIDRSNATRGKGSDLLLDARRVEVTRHEAEDLIPAMWSMRHRISLYDGAYVALARTLQVPLVTRDRKLATTATAFCEVRLLEWS